MRRKILKVKFCRHLEKLQREKTLKGKMEKFSVDCDNILTVRIDIIGIYMNIISELVFSIILHLFHFYILLESEY